MNTLKFPSRLSAALVVGLLSLIFGSVVLAGRVDVRSSYIPGEIGSGNYARLVAAGLQAPLGFESKEGEDESAVQFLVRGSGYTVYLNWREVTVQMPGGAGDSDAGATVLRVGLLGANPDCRLVGQMELPTKINYLLGKDVSRWRKQVPTFGRVKAAQVYPGIDLVYYGDKGQLEYDFTVQPGADPRQIRFGFTGATRLEVDGQGDLVIFTSAGQIRHRRPQLYQEMDGRRRAVRGGYVLLGDPKTCASGERELAFAVGRYDHTRALIIDPVLSFATLFGGSGDDRAYGVAVDRAGNVYVTGQTVSLDFPSAKPWQAKKGGNYDVFVAKFQANGAGMVYGTYIGGDGNDCGFQVAVDEAGNAWVAGETQSTNFPTSQALQGSYGGGARDGFVLKLSADGSGLVFGTYLGGSGADRIACVTVDPAGNAYLCGDTDSTNFPTASALLAQNRGKFDGFAAKLSPKGELLYSTYLGGSGPFDCAVACAADAGGHVYLTGYTSSPDFPVVHALQPNLRGTYDAFITKINPYGSDVIYSTYLGGSANDVGRGIALDAAGSVYISGDTFSTDFPTVKPLQAALGGKRDVFVSKINPAGSGLVYSTYLGGAGEELASLALDSAGSVCLVGLTTSTNFPTVNPLQATFGGGAWDAFVAKLSQSGEKLVFSSFLGGSGVDQGTGITVDEGGDILVCGSTSSTNFPTLKAFQAENRGGANDAFLVKISNPSGPAVPAKATVIAETPATAPNLAQATPSPERTSVAKQPEAPRQAEPLVTNLPPSQMTPPAVATNVAPTNLVASPTEAAVKPPPDTNTLAGTTREVVAAETNLLQNTLFGTNLIVNGDAEAGSASRDSYASIPIPGWVVTNHLTVLRYGTPGGFPSANDPGPSERGKNMFVGGPQDASSAAVQTVSVEAASAAIDQGQVNYTLAGYLGGVSAQKDNALVRATFQDGKGATLGQASIGPVMPEEREYKTGLVRISTKGRLPAGTRKIEIRLEMTRLDGAYDDSFADDLSLVLSPEAKAP